VDRAPIRLSLLRLSRQQLLGALHHIHHKQLTAQLHHIPHVMLCHIAAVCSRSGLHAAHQLTWNGAAHNAGPRSVRL
jgi:hypothetical protein